jgi:hypothetical protein
MTSYLNTPPLLPFYLIPWPLLPEEKGKKKIINLLGPSPLGEPHFIHIYFERVNI